MQDIEALTNRIILIGKGKILYDGGLKEIKNKYQDKNSKEMSTDNVIAKLYKELKI